MNERSIGTMAAFVGIVGVGVDALPGFVLAAWTGGEAALPLPTFGTMGETVLVYQYLNDIVWPLVLLGLAVGLGYYGGRRVDLPREFRRFLGTVLAGSSAGVALVVLGLIAYRGWTSSVDAFSAFVVVALFLRYFVSVALIVTLGALAGATVLRFGGLDGRPPGPTESDAGDHAFGSDDAPEDADLQSRPS